MYDVTNPESYHGVSRWIPVIFLRHCYSYFQMAVDCGFGGECVLVGNKSDLKPAVEIDLLHPPVNLTNSQLIPVSCKTGNRITSLLRSHC